MPSFSNPWNNVNSSEEINKEDIISAIRFAIAAELEAINIYEQIANKSSIPYIKRNMKSLAEEEMVHVGELLSIIANLNNEEFSKYKEGMIESNKILKKL